MALTNIEMVRLNVGDRVEPYFLSDSEIESFLLLSNDNVRKTSVKVATCILGYLAANPSVYRERTGEEEVYTTDPFKAYKEFLQLYIKNPQMYLDGIMPYAAGLTKSDAAIYNSDKNNNVAGWNLPNNVNSVKNIDEYFNHCTPVPVVE